MAGKLNPALPGQTPGTEFFKRHNSQGSGNLATGGIITAKPGAATVPPFDTRHTRIGWHNAFGSAGAAGHTDAALALTPATYERIVSDALTLDLTYTLTDPAPCDYVALAGLIIGSQVVINVGGGEVYNGEVKQPAILVEFSKANISSVNVVITTLQAPYPQLSVFYCGQVLQMMRPQFNGVSPLSLSQKTTFTTQTSEAGQFLGRRIVRQGATFKANFKNLDPVWYRDHFKPFVDHARLYPFFYSWSPYHDPDGVGFCWCNADIVPTNQGVRDYLQVAFDLGVHK